MSVFVIDKHKKPLMPCTEKRARLLLDRERAVVHRMEPFTIRLKDRSVKDSVSQHQSVKLDPGAKVTGVAIIQKGDKYIKSPWLGEIHHKTYIKSRLYDRRMLRRNRRSRKTRYRKPRFDNRKRDKGWLPPSLKAQAHQTLNAIQKLQHLTPLHSVAVEHVKFDTQLMEQEVLEGVEYQQGTLFGYEVREYLLEKFDRKCAYCLVTDVPLQVEHVIPKSKGGSNRVSNLTISCEKCNSDKDNLSLEEWSKCLSRKQTKKTRTILRQIPIIKGQLKHSLKEAAFMNTVRWYVPDQLKALFPSIELGSGARTKMNRLERRLPKTHYYDALCVGPSGSEPVDQLPAYVQMWKANGRGHHQMATPDRYGLPKTHRGRLKRVYGFQTGDIALAEVPKGKKQGTYRGRVTVRQRGAFNILDLLTNKRVNDISYKYFKLIQRGDGWSYYKEKVQI